MKYMRHYFCFKNKGKKPDDFFTPKPDDFLTPKPDDFFTPKPDDFFTPKPDDFFTQKPKDEDKFTPGRFRIDVRLEKLDVNLYYVI